jgi:serine phosphatase RsbU (regulator of sigma subunit)
MATLRVIFLCLLGWAVSVAVAQTLPPTEAVTGIRIGSSSQVSLPGPWKFSPGDSPGSGETLLWASPSFDDSAWYSMDMHSQAGQIDPGYGDPEYLKGWSANGFPNLVGYAWYRLRVHVTGYGQQLGIKMPDHTDDSYQVFANGQYVGEFGQFTADGVKCYRSRAMTFALPAPDAHGDLLIAIRFYEEPFVLVGGTTGDSGGMHQAPVIGLLSQVQDLRARERTGRILAVIVSVFVSAFLLIASCGAFWIWLIDRPRRTYLWLALGLVLLALPALVMVVAFFTHLITQGMVNEFIGGFGALGFICWIFFWHDWFELQWTRRFTLLTIAFALPVAIGESGVLFSTHIPMRMILAAMVLRAAGKFALGVLLFVALFQGARKDRIGAWLALPPILLLTFSQFSQELISWFRIRTSIFPFGVQITVQDAALVLLVLVTGALAVRRFIGSQVSQRLERQTIDQEMEQARELQQRVLVPEENTSTLFAVQTAYHPARTVGGDFFQVIAYPDDSLLVVVGDVSGKGMAAAMLVAVLVGALRTRADETADPAEILRTLNERLLGRAGSHFATCVAAHLSPRGVMTVANAGHLPPYVNGVALDLPGSMPLGILPGNRPDLETVALSPGDYISFLTDGVLEARNADGQLLGFEQTARLSSQPAEAIALAAIQHGQDDDITVVGVSLASIAPEGRKGLRMEASPA